MDRLEKFIVSSALDQCGDNIPIWKVIEIYLSTILSIAHKDDIYELSIELADKYIETIN